MGYKDARGGGGDLPSARARAVRFSMEDRAFGSSEGSDTASIEVRVRGRVQGVGFRYFAHELARRLRLVGYVTNLRDGSLRAYAEGSRQALEVFLHQMERGPAGAAVHEAQSHWGPATGQFTCFSIEHRAL